ncbi:CSN1a [Drosophila busckii]|uniref:CSN1a n=1 Tax=Drosophila busckii TaxID=30019 RepID=A0A0M4ERU3_DROBS|nr:CSN1a [Drosophila busckii]
MICGSVSRVHNESDEQLVISNAFPSCTVVMEPQIHLASYAKFYADHAKLIRLRFIAHVCPKLRVEALQLAIDQVKTTYNVKLYDELYKELERSVAIMDNGEKAAPSARHQVKAQSNVCKKSPSYDAYWVEDNTMESTLLQQELDAELNFNKCNSGGAYVRRIIEEIGDYHVKSGNLQQAIKYYARARAYCTNSDHVINMFRNLIKVSIYMGNWWHVLSYIDDAKQYAIGFENMAREVPARLSCAAGVAYMCLKIYKTAAHCFLLVPFDRYDYDDIVAPQDVAYYAGLCALASFDLTMLQLGCLNAESFKPFLSLAPKMWDIMFKFCRGEYGSCMHMLHDIEAHIRLDVYLAPHVDTLYQNIRARMQELQLGVGQFVSRKQLQLEI